MEKKKYKVIFYKQATIGGSDDFGEDRHELYYEAESMDEVFESLFEGEWITYPKGKTQVIVKTSYVTEVRITEVEKIVK